MEGGFLQLFVFSGHCGGVSLCAGAADYLNGAALYGAEARWQRDEARERLG